MNTFVKSLTLAALITTSFQALASDLIKTHDGAIATCQSKSDVEKHAIGGIYRPVKIEQSQNSAKITLEFLRCVHNNGQFKFVRDQSIEKRKSSVTDLSTRDLSTVELSMQRSNTSILAFNGKGDLIDRQALKKNADGTYSAKISTLALDYDNSPIGKKSLEIAVQSEFVLDNLFTGENVDRGYENLGSYRLIIK